MSDQWDDWQIGKATEFVKIDPEKTQTMTLDGDTVAYRHKHEPVVETVTVRVKIDRDKIHSSVEPDHMVTYSIVDGAVDCATFRAARISE